VDSRLKRGEEGARVSFKTGDTIVLDTASAEDLIKQGIAKSLAPVFVRPLNDYEYAFREVRRQITAALQDARLIERELAEMQKSQGIADTQVRMRQQERSKLDKDFGQYSRENEVITTEATRLSEALNATRTELSNMFQQIQSMRDQIVAEQRAATEAINAIAPIPGR
jgi:chromosome segregation ATPase